MAPQQYAWTCSVCSFTWVIDALEQVAAISREAALAILGYPECVNETYGLMNAQCLVDGFGTFGLDAFQAWVTFDQAYAIAREHTGIINPVGMYHVMGIRGVVGQSLSVANSAPGYCGVGELLSRDQFDSFGPVQVVYLPESHPA
jgi:hypothetical protein